jgi:hypothetical protein
MIHYISCFKKKIELEAPDWNSARELYAKTITEFPDDLVEWYSQENGKTYYITNRGRD